MDNRVKYLITGHPRSGTGYMSRLLKECGKDIPHELKIGNDGVSSWMHADRRDVQLYWMKNGVPEFNPDRTLHLVRHPLKVISSSHSLAGDDAMKYMLGEVSGDRTIDAMRSWLEWNDLISSNGPQYFLRIETIAQHWEPLRAFFGIERTDMPNIPKNINSRPHKKLTWGDLEKADSDLCAKVKEKAEQYGYSTTGDGIEPAKISVCMIVRDEERNLPRCLDSVKQIAEEIVVVDTGSKDRTKDVAEKYGARIFDSPWQDDFSYHRNESFSKARFEWILRIDADEELILNGTPEQLKIDLASIPEKCDACRCLIQDMRGPNVAMEFQQMHFFRNGAVHWKNRKHNFPEFGGAVYQLQSCHTKHYGYDITPEERDRKRARDVRLIEKMDEENPDFKKKDFYLSQIYGQYDGDREKALEHALKYIEENKDDPWFNASIYMTAHQQLEALGRNEEAEKMLMEAVERYPKDIDLNFLKCRTGTKKNDSEMMTSGALAFVRAWNEKDGNPALDDGRFHYFRNHGALCYCLHKLAIHNSATGLGYISEFFRMLPNAPEGIRTALENDMNTDLAKIGFEFKN